MEDPVTRMPLPEPDWFAENVIKSNGCWEWTGIKNAKGYGRRSARLNGKKYWLAHRYSWALSHGHPGKFCVLHKCDNPACVNPDHLFLGTNTDNNRDRDRKGRTSKGEGRPGAKLTEKQVREIRQTYTPTAMLAAWYGVSRSAIRHGRNGRYWKHLGGAAEVPNGNFFRAKPTTYSPGQYEHLNAD